MFNEITKTVEWGGRRLELKTGKIARQADGAVMVKMGESVVLCTAVSSREVKENRNFFPLTVHYREMAYSAGKIPGGFFKREGKGSEKEVLVSRLIDRPIRPLFHSGFLNDTQVICTLLSYDPECTSTDILAIIGASAALGLSGVPFQELIAASRVGMIGGQFVLNPSFEMLKNSQLDLVVAGTESSVMMVESEADLLSEEQMLAAIKFGHQAFQPVIEAIKALVKEAGKPKWPVAELFALQLKDQISQMVSQAITQAFTVTLKQSRVQILKQILTEVTAKFAAEFTQQQIDCAFDQVKSEILRSELLTKHVRIDGRKPEEIRNIQCEVAVLPKTHGSSLFTRGETQALVVATLGTGQDEQIVDSLDGEYKERFMLNYIFPPYCVGETTQLRAPGRREIGHGKLAWRSINKVLPTKEHFPYTIRIVAEITECNGSSSMATICGTSMALMDAGVPIKMPIAGIAMGLIKSGEQFIVLSDITGDEDYLGDMDFKVAGSREGVTALQMDIKVGGINFDILSKAFEQAKAGRLHILDNMSRSIAEPQSNISQYAPCIKSFKIDKDKIREVIGPGGKVIREICESTKAKIDINDEGIVSVSAVGNDRLEAAISRIKAIIFEPEIGGIFSGKVVKVLESGAFINYFGSRDGFVHISEISQTRIESVSKALNEGDVVTVKIIGFDNKGKAKLTIKSADKQVIPAVLEIKVEVVVETAPQEPKNPKPETKRKAESNNVEENGVVKERKYFN